ncbi:TIMELESS-interacting protein [Tripterygium wilfordii]|uniref:TIMELESS-interacting protein n=1 Tax=Tripterygium wilfordii TaxID=458696 RepID=A0A7J7DMA8_TRIWF|nr:TIMELESS-interacting protein [Tripterygium wilfordii]KAF5747495.1 TIMELESS-interacting protein [Tripterygium wilfordii]
MEKGKAAAPTGCYKCGLPGHWSRDCPSSSAPDSNPNPRPSNFNTNSSSFRSSSSYSKPVVAAKPKKVPRSRPKLTPELLLSDDGLGYVLRHFPRAFRYRGRGHEVSDLGNLIRMYSEWHSHLIPYYSFDQFVHKTEQVAATQRVKTCIRELRERVANGGDPTKLHEPPAEHDGPSNEQDLSNPGEGVLPEGQSHHEGVSSPKVNSANGIEEDMLHDIYQRTLEEQSQALDGDNVAGGRPFVETTVNEVPNQVPNSGESCSEEDQITAEQRARMEANRQRALERAAARKRSAQAA